MDISNIKVKYNVKTEVSEKAFNIIMNQLAGTCAGRKEDDGKYYILPWLMNYRPEIKKAIAMFPL